MPDDTGGGNVLSRKIMGMPGWVVLAGVAVLAYFVISRFQGNQQTPTNTTTGGGGTVRTGNTTIRKGAIVVNVKQGEGDDDDVDMDNKKHHQPHPKSYPRQTVKAITVQKDETLEELAKYLHWSPSTLQQVINLNKEQGGGEFTPETKLHKGQTILRPWRGG